MHARGIRRTRKSDCFDHRNGIACLARFMEPATRSTHVATKWNSGGGRGRSTRINANLPFSHRDQVHWMLFFHGTRSQTAHTKCTIPGAYTPAPPHDAVWFHPPNSARSVCAGGSAVHHRPSKLIMSRALCAHRSLGQFFTAAQLDAGFISCNGERRHNVHQRYFSPSPHRINAADTCSQRDLLHSHLCSTCLGTFRFGRTSPVHGAN